MKKENEKREFESEVMILPAIRMVLNEPKMDIPVPPPEPLKGTKKPVNRAVVVKLINKLSRRD